MKVCDVCHEPFKLRNTRDVVWRVDCLCKLTDYEPKSRATVVVLSKFPEIFEQCRVALDKYAPLNPKVLVRDGHDIVIPKEPWTTIQAPSGQFVYARNANLGISVSAPTSDIFLMNDDVTLTHRNTLDVMQGLMDRHPEVGILSPLIRGDVGEYQQSHCDKTLVYTDVRLCFVAVMLKRAMLDKSGWLDERFTGYGYDDCDASRRCVNAGFKLGVTNRAVVIHGHGQDRRSASYNRNEYGTINALDEVAKKQYFEKWGDLSLECR